MFHGVLEEAPEAKENERPFMPHLDAARRCPCCGVPLIEGETICSACRRKRAEATRQKIHQVLKKRLGFPTKIVAMLLSVIK